MEHLLIYAFASVLYIMFIHFALAMKNQFNIAFMAIIFVGGAVTGWIMNSYEIGFILSVILSLVFW